MEMVEGCACDVGGGGGPDEMDGFRRAEEAHDVEPIDVEATADEADEDESSPIIDDVDYGVEDGVVRTGCPGCVHYLSCDQYNAVLDKRAALVVLRATIDAEARAFPSEEELLCKSCAR